MSKTVNGLFLIVVRYGDNQTSIICEFQTATVDQLNQLILDKVGTSEYSVVNMVRLDK
jgi:hypothetical protein